MGRTRGSTNRNPCILVRLSELNRVFSLDAFISVSRRYEDILEFNEISINRDEHHSVEAPLPINIVKFDEEENFD